MRRDHHSTELVENRPTKGVLCKSFGLYSAVIPAKGYYKITRPERDGPPIAIEAATSATPEETAPCSGRDKAAAPENIAQPYESRCQNFRASASYSASAVGLSGDHLITSLGSQYAG